MPNTGIKVYLNLEEYYLDSDTPTGLIEPNIVGNPNYVPPVFDPIFCPPPSPTPTTTPSVTVTPTITPSITVTPTVTPSITTSPSVTPTVTPSITITPSITVTPTVTPSITRTPSLTPSKTPSITPSKSTNILPVVIGVNATVNVCGSQTSFPGYKLGFYIQTNVAPVSSAILYTLRIRVRNQSTNNIETYNVNGSIGIGATIDNNNWFNTCYTSSVQFGNTPYTIVDYCIISVVGATIGPSIPPSNIC